MCLPVKRLLQLLGIALALLWAPLTSHCAWESIPALQMFQCAADTAEDTDCEGDACAQVETASYKITDPQTSVPAPSFIALIEFSLTELAPPARSLPVTTIPPEVPTTWRFCFRAALPPRAPDLVS
jgi:hypothetical protein